MMEKTENWIVLRIQDGGWILEYFDTQPEAVEYAARHQEDQVIIAKVVEDRESIPVSQRGRRSRKKDVRNNH